MGVGVSSALLPDRSTSCPSPYFSALPTHENERRRGEPMATQSDELTPPDQERSPYFLMSQFPSMSIETNSNEGPVYDSHFSRATGRGHATHKQRRGASSDTPRDQTGTSECEPGCFGLRRLTAPRQRHNSSSDISPRLGPAIVSSPVPPPYARAMSVFSSMFSDLTAARSRSEPRTRGRSDAHTGTGTGTGTSKASSKQKLGKKKKVWIKNGVSLVSGNGRPLANSSPAAPPLYVRRHELKDNDGDLLSRRKSQLRGDRPSLSPAPPPLCYHPLLVDRGADSCWSASASPVGQDATRVRSSTKPRSGIKRRKETDPMARGGAPRRGSNDARGDAPRRCSKEVLDLQDHASKARGRGRLAVEQEEEEADSVRASSKISSDSGPRLVQHAYGHRRPSFDEFDSDLSSDSCSEVRSPDLSYFSLVPHDHVSSPGHTHAHTRVACHPDRRRGNSNSSLHPTATGLGVSPAPQGAASNHLNSSRMSSHNSPDPVPGSASAWPSPAASPLVPREHELELPCRSVNLDGAKYSREDTHAHANPNARFVIRDPCSPFDDSDSTSASPGLNCAEDSGDDKPFDGDSHAHGSTHRLARGVFPMHPLESSPSAAAGGAASLLRLGGRTEGLLPHGPGREIGNRGHESVSHDAYSTRVTNDIVERCLRDAAHARASPDASEPRALLGAAPASRCDNRRLMPRRRPRSATGRPSSENATAGNVGRYLKTEATALRNSRTPAKQKQNSGVIGGGFMSSPRKSVCDVLGRLKLKRDARATQASGVRHMANRDARSGHGHLDMRVKTSSVESTKTSSRYIPLAEELPHQDEDETFGVIGTSEVSPLVTAPAVGAASASNARAVYANLSPRAARVSHRTVFAQVDAARGVCVQRRCVLKSYHHLGFTRRVAERLLSLMNFEESTPSFPDVLSFEGVPDDAQKYAPPSISEMLAADHEARAQADSRQSPMEKSIPMDINSLFYHPPSYRFEAREYPSILEIEHTFCRLITDLKLYESSLIGALILIERLVGLTSAKAEASISCMRRMSLACRGNECAHRRKTDEFRLHKNNWRTILYVAIMTTQKIWDDVSWTTENFAKVVSWFSFAHSRRMEAAFLNLLHWDVSLSAVQYNSFMKSIGAVHI